MTNIPDKAQLEAKKKQLKLLMVIMLAFMVLAPLLGPKIFAEDFAHLRGVGLYVFYIGTPVAFGAAFLFYLVLSRRIEKKIKNLA